MPKKDPITGCQVMTMGEFWQAEAVTEGKGRDAGEVADDFYREMAEAEEADRKRFFEPANLVQVVNGELQHSAEHDGEDALTFRVTALIDLHEDHEFRDGMRGGSVAFRAQFMCDDGVERWLSYYESHDYGSFYEPPEGESGVEVIEDPSVYPEKELQQ